MLKTSAVLLISATLTACAANEPPVVAVPAPMLVYPTLPSDQVTGCKRASVKGQTPRVAWRRAEEAFDACAAKQRRLVEWYDELKATKGTVR